jgi:RNA polymerase sigma-70 factor, ECF subfamily
MQTAMMAAATTGTWAAAESDQLTGRRLPRLLGSRSSWGEAMPDMAALIEPHIPGLRRFAFALLRGDRHGADDLVQDCLERALSRWHQRRSEGDLRGWLYTILYNRFLSDQHRRQRRGMHHALLDVAEAELPGIAGGQDSAMEHRDLLRAFAALPEEQRSVLVLVAVEDLSYQETARVLGVPIGTVMSRLSRGRERLRHLMDGRVKSGRPGRRAALTRVQ